MQDNSLIWVEISRTALTHNFQIFRDLVGPEVQLAPMVKSNSYGHGMLICAPILRAAGADYLAVNALFEARRLRAAGDTGPIYILGYILLPELAEAVELDCEFVVYNSETLAALSELTQKTGKTVRVHLKVETGMHRQGLALAAALELAEAIRATPGVVLAGVTTHLADSDNAEDPAYTESQLAEFNQICAALRAAGHTDFLRHAANSAGALLFSVAHFEFARPGLSIYGMWPSAATRDAVLQAGKGALRPVMTWKTRVAQVKTIPSGAKVGYGCTWEAARETRIAVLPIGYYDCYTRAYSNRASVIIRGQRAPIVGRVCMNVCMVDVTDISVVKIEDEVVLLGRQGEAEITADELAEISGTINYEVTTRIRENIERRVVE